jgi:hypothetical protein
MSERRALYEHVGKETDNMPQLEVVKPLFR